MFRKKTEKVNTEASQAAEKLHAFRRLTGRKGIAAIASLALLVSLVILGTVAWYTRISNVAGMTVDAADFDFNANYVGTDFIIDVDDFLNVDSGKVAPGTGGIIPIRVSTSGETTVSYSINLDFSEMADEFRQRIRFYYYENGTGAEVTIDPASSLETGHAISGTLAAHGSAYEFLYWEWVYELNETGWFYDLPNQKWWNGSGAYATDAASRFTALYPNSQQAKDDHDAYDTSIGMGLLNDSIDCYFDGVASETTIVADEDANGSSDHLYAYQKAMYVKLKILGAQASPRKLSEVPEGERTTYTNTATRYVGLSG